MGELLDYNVKLSDLQNQYSSVFEGTGEKRRTLDNMEERKIEKRLLLLNIKLAISNMFRYAMRRKVSLPGDEQEDIDVSSASIPGKIQFRILS